MTFPIDEFLRHQTYDTYTFPLHASSIGRPSPFEVTCRRLEITDRASLGFLPSALQSRVWSQLKTTVKEIQSRENAGQEAKDINEALSNIDDQLKVADILCEYGWIEPKVTRDPAKEDHAGGVVWIGRFKGADRIAYMIGCNNADSEQAKLFRVLRSRPDDAVPGGEGGEVVPDAPQRPAGDPTPPVQFHAPVSGG